jgi:lipid II:glycine glycyltransferase (peptidoglycan interpeptide bridge formation enzyme)
MYVSMAGRAMRPLAAGYAAEVDAVDEPTWYRILDRFDDANIFQTSAFAEVRGGRGNTSHLVLRHHGTMVAAAQARVMALPLVGVGVAYVRWGPLWKLRQSDASPETFRQALRALRNEYACRRGLVVRLYPVLFDDDAQGFASILREEGFSAAADVPRPRTVRLDLSVPLPALREGLRPHWRRDLKIAERNGLEIIEGSDDELFARFITIYREMVVRKNFVELVDADEFRAMQRRLPAGFKMRIMLCRSGGEVCAGLVCSTIGNTAIYLLGATGNAERKSRASFLLHWKLIEWLKANSVAVYDLHGVNPLTNPGTYRFKKDLAGSNGTEVSFLGRFDACANALSQSCLEWAEALRAFSRKLRNAQRAGRLLRARAMAGVGEGEPNR